jgi:hypothetical protein
LGGWLLLLQLGAPNSNLEAKFAALEGGSDVDDELSRMKLALGERKPIGQLPEGRS